MQNQSPLGTRLSGGAQQDRWQALSQESHSSRMSPSSAEAEAGGTGRKGVRRR